LAPNNHLDRTTTLLIFDCDGVLVDSERLACSALAELMTTLGHAMTTEEAVLAFAGSSLNDVLSRAEELLSGPIPQRMGEQTAMQLLARLRGELTAVAGVKEAIAALPYRRCVASSSGPERLSLSLEVSGLSPVFGNDVFSAAQVANGKPAPDLFLLAARCLETDPSSCIVIEDSVLGIEAAQAAGMAAIGFAGASHAGDELARRLAAAGAETVIRSMAELPMAVRGLIERRQVQT
jgi:HAD superfamily hydrolase (TIGR01509 family)